MGSIINLDEYKRNRKPLKDSIYINVMPVTFNKNSGSQLEYFLDKGDYDLFINYYSYFNFGEKDK